MGISNDRGVIEEDIDSGEVYSREEVRRARLGCIPHHLALIMDGNRRWAQRRGYPKERGLWRGASILPRVVQASMQLGVKVLTLYVFSTENWQRPQQEIDAAMNVLHHYLIDERARLIDRGVRLHIIGNVGRLPPEVGREMDETLRSTSNCRVFDLILAINYGGRDEIVRAVNSILIQRGGETECGEVTQEMLSQHLDTARWPDPDLVVRTGGESRMSNFLTWQTVYSELIVLDVLWPEFSPKHLLEAVTMFQRRWRRFGR